MQVMSAERGMMSDERAFVAALANAFIIHRSSLLIHHFPLPPCLCAFCGENEPDQTRLHAIGAPDEPCGVGRRAQE